MKWIGTVLPAALFFTLFQYQWWIRMPFECYVLLPVFELAALFAIISLFYRKSISKQIYLAVTFQAVFEMCDVLRTYGELFWERLHSYLGLSPATALPVYTYAGDPETFSYPVTVVVGLDWPGCLMLLLSCGVLILSTRKLVAKARQDVEKIPRSELFFLLTPAAAAIVFAVFTKVARYLLGNMVFVDWATWDSPFSSLTLYFLIPLLSVATLLCILYAYTIYQKLVAYLEEKQRAAILANQLEQMQGHIREIEQLYTGIRSFRHGLGFQNIIRCAEKYLGNANYTYSGQTFRLTVMLKKSNAEDKEPEEAAVL